MQSILVATDLTERAVPALRAAARLAQWTGAALHVAHVREGIGMPPRESLCGGSASTMRGAEEALELHLSRATPAAVLLASREVMHGPAPEAIAARAHMLSAELVVLGAPGERGAGTLLAITAGARVPCLIVQGSFELPFERVMLPLCATAAGLAALREACAWLAAIGRSAPGGGEIATELEVLHVARRFAEWRELAQELDREVAAFNDLPGRAPLRLYPSVRWGVTSDVEILFSAAEQRPDLVVLGPGGRVAGEGPGETALTRDLSGEFTCPVLLLPDANPTTIETPHGIPAQASQAVGTGR